MVLMVAANEDDIVPAGGIVEPPARYEIILEAAIEEVAAEDVEDIVFDAIGQRRGGIEQRVKGALKITDVNDAAVAGEDLGLGVRSEEHTSELQSLMRISSAVFCLQKKQ